MRALPVAASLGLIALLVGPVASVAFDPLAWDPASEGWSTRQGPEALETDAVAAASFVAAPVATDALDAVPVFGGEARVDNADRIGEPGISAGPDGTLYVDAPGRFWRSQDGGATWTKLNMQGVVVCGCDADSTVDDLNNVWYADLNFPNCTQLGLSPVHGDAWVPMPLCNPGQDRQWIETSGSLHTYATYRIGGRIHLHVAEANPVPAFAPFGSFNVQNSNFRAGGMAVDRATDPGLDRAVLTYTSGNTVRVVVTELGGVVGGLAGQQTNGVVAHDYLVATTGGSNLDAFSSAAVDAAGNIYVVWNERAVVGGATITHSMYASSTDHGATWSAPHKLEQGPATTVYPWPVAGGAGQLFVTYYGSSQAALPGSVSGDWYVYGAYTENALDPAPTLQESLVVPHKVRTGPICTQGTGCAGGSRAFLDFYVASKMADGTVIIAFNDSETLASSAAPYVHFVKQLSGPKLI
ncbi:MAG TPA: hypothetical protein VGR28_06350 [Candidatus Thermoplasmatota archaeon]|jgi:hypothetical protein|nr:hypothetical protein [Candidatus Thermoplasmatota archaeon]